MKKFVIKILCFFIFIMLSDFVFGIIMCHVEELSKSSNYHCKYEANEDVLILGSSYAVRNIVPQVIEDSLGVTCYNAGEAGVGVLCAWVRLNMFLSKHTPKLVIYTLTPGYDYLDTDEYSKYLGMVKGYYGVDDTVNQLYDEFGDTNDKYKLVSNFVKYNSNWVSSMVKSLRAKDDFKGYKPMYTSFEPYEIEEKDDTTKVDTLKLSYVEKLFALLSEKKIPTICLITPQYGRTKIPKEYSYGLELCDKHNITIVNDIYWEKHYSDATIFYDCTHLNDTGAKLYTSRLCHQISKYVN